MADTLSFVFLAQEAPSAEPVLAIGLILYLLCAGLSLVMSLALLAFWIWMIIDCASNEPSGGNDKLVWILVIVLLNWMGAAVYYFARRPQRIAKFGR